MMEVGADDKAAGLELDLRAHILLKFFKGPFLKKCSREVKFQTRGSIGHKP